MARFDIEIPEWDLGEGVTADIHVRGNAVDGDHGEVFYEDLEITVYHGSVPEPMPQLAQDELFVSWIGVELARRAAA